MNRGAARVSEAGDIDAQLGMLDELDFAGERIGLLKIDVEGYENKVLLGARH
ncbi:MAG: FkbM family methyltransferase [Halioglobus sp.]